MKIRLDLPEIAGDFIRHARTETLKSVDETPTPPAVEPSPFGFYFIAYDEEDGNRPIALAESAFYDQVYPSFADSPYPASLNLDQFCPFEEMAGVRTIYVEPDCRHRSASLYLQLILAGAQTFWELGARYVTATTNADNAYLNRLYAKTGGHALNTFRGKEFGECEVAPWVFHIDNLRQLNLMKRAALGMKFEIDLQIAHTLRARTRWNQSLEAA